MSNKFNIGDHVFASDWCYGEIVDITGDMAHIQFDTGFGNSVAMFRLSELQPLLLAQKKDHNADASKMVKKECVASCIEFVLCCLMAMAFLTAAILALMFKDWMMFALCAIVGLISGYCSVKSVGRYFDLTQSKGDVE